jgi:hypothetical protein
MGRGRAKAKQTKVARELKYSTGSLDPEALRRELAQGGLPGALSTQTDELDDDEDDDEDERDD